MKKKTLDKKKKILDARQAALLAVRQALEKKAYDLVLLEVGNLTSLGEYFLICTGRSDRQVQAIAQSIEDGLRAAGVRPIDTEGFDQGHWILLDYADVIVHVFYEPVREFYDLERLWARAPRVELPEPYRSQAQELQLAAN